MNEVEVVVKACKLVEEILMTETAEEITVAERREQMPQIQFQPNRRSKKLAVTFPHIHGTQVTGPGKYVLE